MLSLSNEQWSEASELARNILNYVREHPAELNALREGQLYQYLRDSEDLLAAALLGAESGKAKGDLKFGLALSRLNQYFPALASTLHLPQSKHRKLFLESRNILTERPRSTEEGAIIAIGPYQQLDPGWL